MVDSFVLDRSDLRSDCLRNTLGYYRLIRYVERSDKVDYVSVAIHVAGLLL